MTPTPLEEHDLHGRRVLLKREDTHELGAFKWRGALPTLERRGGDVVTASTGNHGAATAWAARRLDVRAIVYVHRDASRGTYTIARTPSVRAAHAVAAPWFPVDAVTTSPPCRSSVGSAPRHLNAPSSCVSSRLRSSVRPATT